MVSVFRLQAAAAFLSLLSLSPLAAADDAKFDPSDPEFKIQGEYVGEIPGSDGKKNVGIQVIALGDGRFKMVGYSGGLPGDGWDRGARKDGEGTLADGVLRLTIPDGQVSIRPGGPLVLDATFAKLEFNKTARKSSTLGAKPPEGAIVLFDGHGAQKWQKGRVTAEGLLMQGTTSEDKFQSCQLHIEFLLPYMPKAKGQGRGNSGCYLQGRYEVQILDSFGLNGEDNECGGLYAIKAPSVNMCYPPQSWQTYDIDFTAAVFKDGKKVKHALLSVKHNGMPIHKDVELKHATAAAPVAEGPEPGPIHLQDHGCPVLYRNIWLLEKK